MKRLWLLISLTILTACSATGPKYISTVSTQADKGTLYIYRPSTFVNSAIAPTVYINDQEKPKLLNGGYQRYILEPGQYTVRTDGDLITWTPGRAEVAVHLKAGGNTFVRLGSHVKGAYMTSGMAITGSNLHQVNEELANKELPDTKLSM